MKNLPFFIASRYLFARKSHNVINIVSAISSVGMAVGTAALIIILSVYNGFDALVKSMMSSVEPDLLVVPVQGKYFVPEGEAYDIIYDCPKVKNMCTVLQDNVFASYEDKQGTVLAKGVDEVYCDETPLRDCVTDGDFYLSRDGEDYAAVGRGFALEMGLNVRFLSRLTLYYPDRHTRFSAVNPMSGVNSLSLWPSCEFSISNDIDNNLVIVPRRVMQELLDCDEEVSAVELRMTDDCSAAELKSLKKEFADALGPDFKVLDRAQQNPALYKMLRYEKLSVYLIMFFIVIILGFSIFGCLSMLIIDKSDDIATFRAIGADDAMIKKIFTLEGWMISLYGMLAGMVVGVAFCLLQQRFGFVAMPGNYMVDAYPVALEWKDVLVSSLSIALLGYLIALIPVARRIGSRTKNSTV